MKAASHRPPTLSIPEPSIASTSDAAATPVTPLPDCDERDRAAAKIQALARGQLVRKQQKDAMLWEAWNQLDWKEEAELMASHQQYEELTAIFTRKKNSESQPNTPTQTSFPPGAAELLGPDPPTVSAAVTPVNDTPSPSIPSTPSHASTSPSSTSPSITPVTSNSSSPSGSPRSFLIRTKTIPKKPTPPVDEEKKKHVGDDPDQLKLNDPINLDFVTHMLDHFKFNRRLDLTHVVEILRRVKAVLQAQPNVVHISVSTRLTVVGDLHGQLDDLLAIFKLNGLPSPRNFYIFNGDFVDRGQYSCECVLTLFAFKLLYPRSVHLNRGNHEARDINSRDGFEKEVTSKYNQAVFDLFSDVFAYLPIASVINNEIFVVHGGLTSRPITIDELQQIDRCHEIPPMGCIQEELLWSDPCDEEGLQESPRGAGVLFGADVTDEFMKCNPSIRLIVRSHECKQKGFQMHHNNKVITVFSASNYCGTVNNEGAIILFERDLVPKIVPFFAKPKERLSRYRMRHAVMENEIISKLLQRISDHRLALTDWYRTVEKVNPASGVRTITRQQWAQGLKTVLKLNIPFLDFQDYLGLPTLGVDGKKKGDIDYMSFLLRFRPVNALVAAKPPATPRSRTGSDSSRGVSENVERILEMLQKNRYELESLFRHFDLNGDELISVSEFKEGIESLQQCSGNLSFTDEDIDALIKHIDTNHDDQISYAEFFNGFRLADPQLHQLQQQQAERAQKRNVTGSDIPPSHAPSPVASPRTIKEMKVESANEPNAPQ